MTSIASRRCCSIISKRTIAAFASSSFTTNNNLSFTLQTQYLHHSSTPSSHPVKNGDTAYPFLFPKNRAFHFKSGPLNFKASSPSLAEYAAIADYESEASSSPKADEGLEVAKLGIAQEIISALAKRGITKLFPIQVSLALTLYLFSLFLLWVSLSFQYQVTKITSL